MISLLQRLFGSIIVNCPLPKSPWLMLSFTYCYHIDRARAQNDRIKRRQLYYIYFILELRSQSYKTGYANSKIIALA